MKRVIDRIPLSKKESQREELANAATHAVGALIFLGAGIALVLRAAAVRGPTGTILYGVFGLTAVNLYAVSALYHVWPRTRTKQILRLADHISIYLLIAGTYTPLTLVEIRGPWGIGLFIAEWTMAAAGVGFSTFALGKFRVLPVVFYVAMGWVAVIAWGPISARVADEFLYWLIAGGVFYTVGTAAYAARSLHYAHAIWHLFVIAGTAAHLAGMYFYLL